jgi:hypothetical protein
MRVMGGGGGYGYGAEKQNTQKFLSGKPLSLKKILEA